jgi:8-oxo-dGTP diphosphatase
VSDITTIAVAVVVQDGCVLVGRRASDALDAAGLHEFPGGKVEAGESPETAAARECLEEAGVSVRVGPLLDRAAGKTLRGPLEILFFTATPVDRSAKPLRPFQWIPIRELPACSFPDANVRVLAALVRDLAAQRATSAESAGGDSTPRQGGS